MNYEQKIAKETAELIALLGYTDVSVKRATPGQQFKDTKTQTKMSFTNTEGQRRQIGVSDNSLDWYYFLKYKWALKNGASTCDQCGGAGVTSQGGYYHQTYGSGKGTCPCCGGYKIALPLKARNDKPKQPA